MTSSTLTNSTATSDEASFNPKEAIAQLLGEFPEPTNSAQHRARECFDKGDIDTLRALVAANLADSFIKALGYMASIYKVPPTVGILLAESSRAIAEAHKEAATIRLNSINSKLLGLAKQE